MSKKTSGVVKVQFTTSPLERRLKLCPVSYFGFKNEGDLGICKTTKHGFKGEKDTVSSEKEQKQN